MGVRVFDRIVLVLAIAIALLCGPSAQVAGVDGDVARIADHGLVDAFRDAQRDPRQPQVGDGDAQGAVLVDPPSATAESVDAITERARHSKHPQGPRRRHGNGRRGRRPGHQGHPGHLRDDRHPGHKKRQQQQKHPAPENEDSRKHKKNNKNKTLPYPEDPEEPEEHQQIRHRKQRQSRRKGGRRRKNETGPVVGSIPDGANSTFRRRSEEKQELVGRRTLQVLSPRGSGSSGSSGSSKVLVKAPFRTPAPSPGLVGILDIPAASLLPAPAGEAPSTLTMAVPTMPTLADGDRLPPPSPPAAGRVGPVLKVAAKPGGSTRRGGGGGGGRRRPASPSPSPATNSGNGNTPGKPLDPDWLQSLLAAAALSTAKAASAAASFGPDDSPSPCDRWISCSAQLKSAIWSQLSQLPACPCTFPANVFYYNKIWDPKRARYFRWRDASGRAERLDVYHPGASHCIRSLHTASPSGPLAAQHCCYDRNRQLLTRGSGAGTPALVSPDVSAALHDTLDVRPWRICKGDFTRYNDFRPPNNDNNCAANPDEAEFQRQTALSQFY